MKQLRGRKSHLQIYNCKSGSGSSSFQKKTKTDVHEN